PGAGAPAGAQAPRARPAPPPPNTGVALSASLFGRGSGYAGVVIDPPAGMLCYMLNTVVDAPTMAHIHAGGPGATGAPVVTLATPAAGASGGCAPIAADLARKILANPGGYYVNVHTAAQPGGAVRGQLGK
ncbi:MAG: CHRD domain-containing protein, partial [Croceibacterium sp.]